MSTLGRRSQDGPVRKVLVLSPTYGWAKQGAARLSTSSKSPSAAPRQSWHLNTAVSALLTTRCFPLLLLVYFKTFIRFFSCRHEPMDFRDFILIIIIYYHYFIILIILFRVLPIMNKYVIRSIPIAIYFLAQLSPVGPVGTLLNRLLCPLAAFPSSVEHFLNVWHHKISQAHLAYALLKPRDQPFL